MAFNDCDESPYYKDGDGYAQKFCSIRKRPIPQNRWVWEEHFGDIPPGLVIRHTCDNPPCININHLQIGTIQDNVRDRVLRGRSGKSLDTQQVLEIRAAYSLGNTTYRELAQEYSVTPTTIYCVVSRRSWKHL